MALRRSKAARAAATAGDKAIEIAPRKGRITPANTKRALAVGKVVLPLLAPVVLSGAAVARDRWERLRAARLGVPVDRLPEFTGKGAALHVRLAGLAGSLAELRERHPEQAEFVAAGEARLADLAAAVRAAEQMPAARRRSAHRGVADELDSVEADLLERWGV